jgi:membrane protease YdiL (CAAX protease family)
MHPVPRRFRLPRILRKLLPENVDQVMFLLAAVCLSACFGRSWLLQPISASSDAVGYLSGAELERWVRLTQVFAWPLLLAGVGAYFCCFSRREKPLRSWIGFVIAPAIAGLAGGTFLPALIVLNRHGGSILYRNGQSPFHEIRPHLRELIPDSGTGFQLAVLGLLLALMGGWMLRNAKGSLPVRFGPPALPARSEDFARVFARQRIFAIYALTLAGFGGNLLSLPVGPVLLRFYSASPTIREANSFNAWFNAIQFLLYVLPFSLISLWALGEGGRMQLRASARLPSMKMFGLAIAVALGAHWLPHVLAYAIDRVAWAQHWTATPEVPLSNLYLHVPPMGWHLILIAVAAILSEWCWRGCIQSQFIQAFGVFRGIVVVGMLYGAVQWIQLPSVAPGLPGFFFHLALQLIWGIVWSVVFGWLTLAARSVWPAAVLAALSSVLMQAAYMDGQEIIPRQFLRLCLLGSGCLAALLLVRYLPLAPNASSPMIQATPVPESQS